MNDQSPMAVATTYFEALNTGDVSAAMSLLDPDVVWHQPGSNRFSGDHRGTAAVAELLQGMMTVSEGTFRLVVEGTPMVNGELAAAAVRFAGSREGASMDMGGVDLLTVRGGAIVDIHLFSEDAAAEDAFWGRPEESAD